jgi:hypothetical protein
MWCKRTNMWCSPTAKPHHSESLLLLLFQLLQHHNNVTFLISISAQAVLRSET